MDQTPRQKIEQSGAKLVRGFALAEAQVASLVDQLQAVETALVCTKEAGRCIKQSLAEILPLAQIELARSDGSQDDSLLKSIIKSAQHASEARLDQPTSLPFNFSKVSALTESYIIPGGLPSFEFPQGETRRELDMMRDEAASIAREREQLKRQRVSNDDEKRLNTALRSEVRGAAKTLEGFRAKGRQALEDLEGLMGELKELKERWTSGSMPVPPRKKPKGKGPATQPKPKAAPSLTLRPTLPTPPLSSPAVASGQPFVPRRKQRGPALASKDDPSHSAPPGSAPTTSALPLSPSASPSSSILSGSQAPRFLSRHPGTLPPAPLPPAPLPPAPLPSLETGTEIAPSPSSSPHLGPHSSGVSKKPKLTTTSLGWSEHPPSTVEDSFPSAASSTDPAGLHPTPHSRTASVDQLTGSTKPCASAFTSAPSLSIVVESSSSKSVLAGQSKRSAESPVQETPAKKPRGAVVSAFASRPSSSTSKSAGGAGGAPK